MAEFTGLVSHPIIAFIPVMNEAGAREFYEKVLGLRLVADELPYALVFDANGIMLRVTPVLFHVPAKQTILGWQVPDIAAAVASLTRAGVQMQRYDFPQDEQGVWTAPNGVKVAWFKDPDGNVLSLTQFEP
jgi:catechol 2,3-dioxygenase-like lactoylglutathione lyase family enzyme